MNQDDSKDTLAIQGAFRKTRISCPGCGRNDYVAWPSGQETFHWKCFNCGRESDLRRQVGH